MLSRDGVAGLVCLAGSVVLLLMTRGLPHPALVPIGPAYYPRILLGLTAVLSGALILSDVLAGRRGRPAGAATAARYRLVVLTFLVFAAYVVLMPWIGYRLATLVFVTVLQVAIAPPENARGWALVLAVAVATSAATYYAFEVYLQVLLPRGRFTAF